MNIIPATGANSGSVEQLWATLQKEGVAVSNSPKNRARLYKRLQERMGRPFLPFFALPKYKLISIKNGVYRA